jgi:hypothetical protein
MVFRVVVIMEGGEVVYHCQNMSQLLQEPGSHRRLLRSIQVHICYNCVLYFLYSAVFVY